MVKTGDVYISKKVDVYDTFVEGTKESFDVVLTMFPTMLAMILGVNIFMKSGIIELMVNMFQT